MNFVLKRSKYICKEDVFLSKAQTMSFSIHPFAEFKETGKELAINVWSAYVKHTGETKGKLKFYKWLDSMPSVVRKRGVITGISLTQRVEAALPQPQPTLLDLELSRNKVKELIEEAVYWKHKAQSLEEELKERDEELMEALKRNAELADQLKEKDEELEDMEEQLDNFAIETEPYDVYLMDEEDVIPHEEEDYDTEDEGDNALRICLETIQKKYKDVLDKLTEANIEVIQIIKDELKDMDPSVVEAEGMNIAERIINEMAELLTTRPDEQQLFLQQQAEQAEQARRIQAEKVMERRRLAEGTEELMATLKTEEELYQEKLQRELEQAEQAELAELGEGTPARRDMEQAEQQDDLFDFGL